MGWKHSKGYYTVERQTLAVLIEERRSVQSLFNVLVSQAFSYRIAVRLPLPNDPVQIWNEGSRTWGLRGLSKTARMSVPTLRRALARLCELGFIRKVSNKLGTVVQVLRFFQYKRRNQNADEDRPANAQLTHPGFTPVKTTNPYRSSLPILQRSLTSYVAVPQPQEVEAPLCSEAKNRIRALISSVIGDRRV